MRELRYVFRAGNKAASEVDGGAGADIGLELVAVAASEVNSKTGAENCLEAVAEGVSEANSKAGAKVGARADVEAVSEDSSDIFSEAGAEVIGVEVVTVAVFETNSEADSEVVA